VDCGDKAAAVIVLRESSDRDETMAGGNRDIVIFDVGGAPIDWHLRRLYRELFAGDVVALGTNGPYFTTPEALRAALVARLLP
jgi:hypothetical protein